MDTLSFSIVSTDDFPLRIDWHRTTTESIAVHKHDFFEMIFIASGKGIHEVDSEIFNINPGDIFLVPPDYPHSFRKRKNTEIINLIFDHNKMPGWTPDLFSDSRNGLFCVSDNRFRPGMITLNNDNQNRLIEELHQLAKRQAENFSMKKLFCITQFFQLCLFLAKQEKQVCNSAETIAEQIVGFMKKNYKRPLAISTIAKRNGISTRTLQRIFRHTYQCSPLTFLNDIRLEKSTYLLQYTSLKISEIAMDTGFSDSNYFCKLFTQKYKVSPRAYRNNVNTKLLI